MALILTMPKMFSRMIIVKYHQIYEKIMEKIVGKLLEKYTEVLFL